MKSKICLLAFLSLSLLSCAQETPKVKHKKSMKQSSVKKNVKVVNSVDPVCHMKTDGAVSATSVYNKKTYGFCSTYCKDEFEKNPEKYVKK